jgi:hypothetical protein
MDMVMSVIIELANATAKLEVLKAFIVKSVLILITLVLAKMAVSAIIILFLGTNTRLILPLIT